MIIDNELKNVMRSHHDLEKDNTPYMKKAMRVCDLCLYSTVCIPFFQFRSVTPILRNDQD